MKEKFGVPSWSGVLAAWQVASCLWPTQKNQPLGVNPLLPPKDVHLG